MENFFKVWKTPTLEVLGFRLSVVIDRLDERYRLPELAWRPLKLARSWGIVLLYSK